MSFPLLLCTNCQKQKEDDDDFLLSGLKNQKGFLKNNFSNSNGFSFSDNNNSTNNLEIIEYPYSSEINQTEGNNNDKISEQVYQPVKTDFVKVKKQNLDYDDDLLDIKPPKLFIETNKNEINDINEIPHLKTEPTNKVENNLYKDNNFDIIRHDVNAHLKMSSNNSESLINNDNSIMNNKILLNNYYLNSQNNKNLQDNFQKIQNVHKKVGTDDLNNINNTANNNNNKIIGVKVDYPCPDTNSFYLNNNTNEKTSLKNKDTEEVSNKKKSIIAESEINEKKLFLEKMKKNVLSKNYIKKSFNKIDKIKPKIKGKKSNINVNIDILNINFQKKKKNSNIKNNNNNNNITIKKKLTFNTLSNFNSRFKLKVKHSNDEISTFFNQTENFQLQKTNNFLLKNILNKKINDKKQNLFKSFLERRKIGKISSIPRVANQTTINTSNTFTNPFIKIYQPQKKKFKLYTINK